MFVLLGFGSCTCTAATAGAGTAGQANAGDSDSSIFGGSSVISGGYDCTCDETDDCASSHVIGGEVNHRLNTLIIKISRLAIRHKLVNRGIYDSCCISDQPK